MLRAHIERFEPNDDLFVTRKDTIHLPQNVGRRWKRVRDELWPLDPTREPADQDPLSRCVPYDLRASNATMLLSSGVAPGEVAKRLGNSVEVIMKEYAGVVEDNEQHDNALIDSTLEAGVRPEPAVMSHQDR